MFTTLSRVRISFFFRIFPPSKILHMTRVTLFFIFVNFNFPTRFLKIGLT